MTTRSRVAVALLGLLLGADAMGQARKVQVGYCSTLKNIEAAKAAGFDYVELGTTEIAALSDDEFEEAAAHIKQVGLPGAGGEPVPSGGAQGDGAADNRDEQMAYVKKAFARLARLGTEIVVFGSGGARRVPEGFPKDEAFKQLVEFGKRIAPEARAHGLTIAIEPLRREETNIINSAAEGLELVKAIDDPNFQLMIDFYHLASEKEDPAIVVRARRPHPAPAHGESARPRVPARSGTSTTTRRSSRSLRKIGYDKRISVEASAKDFPSEAPQAIALLRRAFER